MQNPSELYRFENDAPVPARAPGALIVLLGAFIDAGNLQRILGTHLVDTSEAEVVATFDVDALLDYRGRRPAMVFDTNRWESYADPSMVLYRLSDRDGQTYYLLTGPEPDFQWERAVEAIRQLIQILGISLVVTSHGIPMGVPHTRPVGMTAHATDARLVGGKESPFGQIHCLSAGQALASEDSGLFL